VTYEIRNLLTDCKSEPELAEYSLNTLRRMKKSQGGLESGPVFAISPRLGGIYRYDYRKKLNTNEAVSTVWASDYGGY
jgi:hypothetical protein